MPLTPISPWHIKTGKRLRAARNAAGYSMTQVAQKLGCTYQIYQRYETATGRLPADVLARVAAIFHVPVEDLLPPNPTAPVRQD